VRKLDLWCSLFALSGRFSMFVLSSC